MTTCTYTYRLDDWPAQIISYLKVKDMPRNVCCVFDDLVNVRICSTHFGCMGVCGVTTCLQLDVSLAMESACWCHTHQSQHMHMLCPRCLLWSRPHPSESAHALISLSLAMESAWCHTHQSQCVHIGPRCLLWSRPVGATPIRVSTYYMPRLQCLSRTRVSVSMP